ncbi:hypothetical protein Pelo_17649 [Pelomyxa schiedti]|nr:hypothetical protein Pelo_17649 [Pelomyxa schiedti]
MGRGSTAARQPTTTPKNAPTVQAPPQQPPHHHHHHHHSSSSRPSPPSASPHGDRHRQPPAPPRPQPHPQAQTQPQPQPQRPPQRQQAQGQPLPPQPNHPQQQQQQGGLQPFSLDNPPPVPRKCVLVVPPGKAISPPAHQQAACSPKTQVNTQAQSADRDTTTSGSSLAPPDPEPSALPKPLVEPQVSTTAAPKNDDHCPSPSASSNSGSKRSHCNCSSERSDDDEKEIVDYDEAHLDALVQSTLCPKARKTMGKLVDFTKRCRRNFLQSKKELELSKQKREAPVIDGDAVSQIPKGSATDDSTLKEPVQKKKRVDSKIPSLSVAADSNSSAPTKAEDHAPQVPSSNKSVSLAQEGKEPQNLAPAPSSVLHTIKRDGSTSILEVSFPIGQKNVSVVWAAESEGSQEYQFEYKPEYLEGNYHVSLMVPPHTEGSFQVSVNKKQLPKVFITDKPRPRCIWSQSNAPHRNKWQFSVTKG